MGLFWGKDQYDGYNIYSMKKYVDKKRIIFTVSICVIATITLLLIAYYSINTIRTANKAKEFQMQLNDFMQKQEEKNRQLAEEKERIRQEKIPKLTETAKNNIKNIYQSEKKRAFLTFDDGPSSNTKQILDLLKETNIKATFFVLGSMVEKMPETTKRIYEEGHFIANHGYSHEYTNVYATPENVLNEYNQCNETIKKAIGEPDYNSHVFRFPGGLAGGKYAEIKAQANQILEQNNIIHVDWNALSGDSEKSQPSPEFLMQRIQETTEGKNSVVILMHDAQAKKVTADTLPQIIDFLRGQGYEFESFYDIMK